MLICVGASSFGKADTTALELLENKGYEVRLNPFGRKLTPEETVEFVQGADGLLAGLEELSEEVLSALPALKAISRIGVGMDNVDIDAASKLGIKVSNTPEAPAAAVAEMTLAALLCCARNLVTSNAAIHQGEWAKTMGFSLYGATVLLVGYGRIAHRFEELLQPFKVRILTYDPALASGPGLEQTLPQADVVSLHASGAECIIGEEELELMKPSAILLNSARGKLVDEAAVVQALKTGALSWYWADSFVVEPYSGDLQEVGNALLTPHASTYTALCRRDMELQATQNLLKDLDDA